MTQHSIVNVIHIPRDSYDVVIALLCSIMGLSHIEVGELCRPIFLLKENTNSNSSVITGIRECGCHA